MSKNLLRIFAFLSFFFKCNVSLVSAQQEDILERILNLVLKAFGKENFRFLELSSGLFFIFQKRQKGF